MTWECILATVGMNTVKRGLRAIRRQVSKRRYKELLAAAVAELLKLDPDIARAQASILAAEALGEPPSRDLLTAKEILGKVKSYSAGGARKATKRKPKPKTAKRKATKKKRTKKPAKKHVARKRTPSRTRKRR